MSILLSKPFEPGKLQINSQFLYGANQFCWVNQWKIVDRAWFVNGDAGEDGYELLDENGYPIRNALTGLGFTNFGSVYLLPPGETWVLDWGGTRHLHACQLGNPNSQGYAISMDITLMLDQRREYSVTSGNGTPINTPIGCIYGISNIDPSAPPKNIRLYRKSHETTKPVLGIASGTAGRIRITIEDTAGVKTGDQLYVEGVGGTTEANGCFEAILINHTTVELLGSSFTNSWTSGGTVHFLDYRKRFRPGFFEAYSGGKKPFGRFRFQQWEDTLNGYSIGHWEDRTRIEEASWIGANVVKKHCYTGIASFNNNDYTGLHARGGNPSSWTDGMMIQMRWKDVTPYFLPVVSFFNENPARLKTGGPHNLVTGDKVFFAPGSMGAGFNTAYRLGWYTVTVLASDEITLDGVDGAATGWGVYSAASAPKTISAIVNQTGRVKITSASHGMVTNDYISFVRGTMGAAEMGAIVRGWVQVEVLDADTFLLPGYINPDVGGWASYTGSAGRFVKSGSSANSNLGVVARQMRAKAGNLPFKPMVATDAGIFYLQDFFGALGSDFVVALIYDEDYDGLMFLNETAMKLGMPIELMVEFCNETRISPVFSISHHCNDDYVIKKATYVRDHLDKDLHAAWSWSNEVWHPIWRGTGYSSAHALIKWPPKSGVITLDPTNNKVNWTGHGLNVGSRLMFSTTGSLASAGIRTDEAYFILADAFGANSFKIAEGYPWAAEHDILTAGTGTHTASFEITGGGFEPYVYMGWRLYYVMSLIKQVFASEPVGRCVTWMDERIVGLGPSTTIYKWAAPGTGVPAPPVTVTDESAIATYIDVRDNPPLQTSDVWKYNFGTPSERDQALQALDSRLRSTSTLDHSVPELLNLAAQHIDQVSSGNIQYGLNRKVSCYEGGLGLFPQFQTLAGSNPYNGVTISTSLIHQYFKGYYYSSYAGKITADLFNGLDALGVVYPSQYTWVGAMAENGLFAAVEPNEIQGNFNTEFAKACQTFNSGG